MWIYTKVPTTHRGCGGIVVKIGNKWLYNACGDEVGGSIVCAKLWS